MTGVRDRMVEQSAACTHRDSQLFDYARDGPSRKAAFALSGSSHRCQPELVAQSGRAIRRKNRLPRPRCALVSRVRAATCQVSVVAEVWERSPAALRTASQFAEPTRDASRRRPSMPPRSLRQDIGVWGLVRREDGDIEHVPSLAARLEPRFHTGVNPDMVVETPVDRDEGQGYRTQTRPLAGEPRLCQGTARSLQSLTGSITQDRLQDRGPACTTTASRSMYSDRRTASTAPAFRRDSSARVVLHMVPELRAGRTSTRGRPREGLQPGRR
jgi:hypothetical protein